MITNPFLTNQYKNISGITLIDSWNPWKNLGLLAITHWNETVGLKLFPYLKQEILKKSPLQQGKLFLIAMNPLAYEKQQRFIDDNMNRISNQAYKSTSYEHQRLDELKPILREMDITLDIHSFSNSHDIVAICDIQNREKAKQIFTTETILVDNLEQSGSIIGYCTRKQKEAYGIECGLHDDPEWFERGKEEILNFLEYYQYLPSSNRKKERKQQNIYQFREKIQPITKDFKFTRDFSWFSYLKENEVFAKDGDIEHKNTLWKNIYLGIPAKEPRVNDNAGFLFKKLE